MLRVLLYALLKQRNRTVVICAFVENPSKCVCNRRHFWQELLRFLGVTESDVHVATIKRVKVSKVASGDAEVGIVGYRLFVVSSGRLVIALVEVEIAENQLDRR